MRPFEEAFSFSNVLKPGFKAVSRAPVPLLLGSLLVQCTGNRGGGQGLGSLENNFGQAGGSGEPLGEQFQDFLSDPTGQLVAGVVLVLLVLALVLALVLVLLHSWLQVGYLRVQRDTLFQGDAELTTLFLGHDRLLHMVLAAVLKGLILGGLLFLFVLPLVVLGYLLGKHSSLLAVLVTVPLGLAILVGYVYVALGLALVPQAVVLDELGPTQAIGRSWELVAGHRLHLLLWGLLNWMFSAVGVLLCCVGVIYTAAVADTAWTHAYLALTREEDEYARSWIAGELSRA